MKKFLPVLTLLSVFFSIPAISQNYNMGNLGTVSNACGGNFYDSGGPNGAYGANQTYTATFCAPAGQYITFTFSSFNVENNFEDLNIYNGPGVGSPMIGSYTGTNSPGTVTSTQGGCLTFYFTSDGSVHNAGWAAAITCSTAPPPPPPPVPGSCATAQPFCTGSGVTFPASTGTTAQAGPNYGCLFSQPNPAWYYLNIATAGNININLSNSANLDIDFAAWGPFATQAAMCAGTSAAPMDCSYSSASTEQINITGATVGQWYIVMITNFSNQPTNISVTTAGGTTGSTNCNILCNMTSLTAVPGACAPATNTYSVTGQIAFQYPPTSGTLTVTSSCGGSVSIPSPWTTPISYTLPNITATGGACSITATFSADPTCTLTQGYTSPAPCNACSITAGNTGPACTSNTINLTATTVAGHTYSWSGPGGYSSTAQNPTGVTVPATAGAYTYTVTAVGSPTCTATTTVTVNPRPTITAPSNVSVCAGIAVPSQNFTSNPVGATYAWTNSNPAVGLAASGTGPVSAFTATNATGAAITSTVTVTPSLGGCAGTPITYTITVNPQPVSTFSQPANQCLTGNTFNFTNTGSSGAGYTYDWTFAGGTPATSTANNVTGVTFATAGAHAISHTVTGPGGCTSTTNSSITIYPMPTGLNATAGPATCGASNGTITITSGVGGTSPYTYSVNGGAFSTTLNYTGQTVGSHPVIVQDANGCQFSTTVTVPSSSGPSALVVNTVNATCGASNGIINIGATTGGTGPYTYSVNGSAFTATTSYPGFAAGTYSVVVRDVNGCTFTTSGTVVNTPGPTAQATSTANSTCGASNGTVTVGATTGGTAAYQYSFNGSAFTSTTNYTALAAGTYTVTVRDANGCTFTVNPVVANTAGPTALAVTTTNSTCGNSNGVITMGAVTGGTAAYTYSVAGSAFTGTTNYSGFAAGTYTVVVKDLNGCTFTTSATVVNSPGPTAIAVTTGNSSCGASNGTITLGAVTGGVPPYTYSVNSSALSGTTAYTGFAAGSYSVVVSDANGCTFTTTANVNNASGPTALVVNSTAANCGASNGTVTIGTVTGGTGPYTYSFNGSAFTTTTNYTAQPAGTYNVSVRDANGCSFTTTVTIANTPGPTALATVTANSTCGSANGTLNIGAVTGGSAAYTYSINGSAFTGTTNYSGLAAGTYTVTVRDVNGCTFTVNPVVGNTPGPTAQATSTTNSTCGLSNGGVAIGNTTGGTSPYTYSFNGGTFGSTVNFTNLAAGTYTVTVKDANNCTFTVNPIVSNTPGPTALATTSVNATCGNSNGAINIGATTGGTPAYTYSFDGGGFTATTSYTGLAAGTHTVIVSDQNGCTFTVTPAVGNTPGPTAIVRNITNSTCGGANGAITLGAVTGGTAPYTYSVNGSVFSTATTYTGLAANTYPVVVQDANGCQFTTTAVVSDLSGLTASITAQTNITCNGAANGSVIVAASGSVAPYSYSLDAGPFVASGTFTGLSVGSHTVTGKDGNGCTIAVPVTITEPSLLTGVIATQTNVACFGGTSGAVSITAGGGTPAYTYSIDGGAFGSSPSFTGLNANPHTVVVRDANLCTVNVPVTITQPTALTLTTSSVNAICTAANGSATVTATGGTPVYTYDWNPGTQTSATASGLTAGNYSVLVTDFNGCTQTANVAVGANPGGSATISSTSHITCNGANDGSATVSMGGASTPPFIYSWTPSGQNTVTATGLSAGGYTVSVTDGNGCIASTSTVVLEPSVISHSFQNTNVSCNGGSDGTSMVIPTGGTPGYTYFWTPGGQNSQTANGLSAGTYTCVITDANGCTKTVTTAITEPPAMVLSETHIDANCNLSNGSATVSATGGLAPYTYSWSTTPVQTNPTATGLAANTYVITVKDANQCTQTLSVTINNLSGPVATVFSSTNVSCNGQNDGSATITINGGTQPFTYSWAPSGGSLPTAANLAAGTYTLNATDANGCSTSASVTITEPLVLNTAFAGINPSCAGECDASVSTSTVGGTAPYSYLWTPGGLTTQNVTGLCAGNYTLQVTDAMGCIIFKNITLTDPVAITANTSTVNVTCSGLCNGSATANALTGNGPFTYLWNDANAQTTQTAAGLCGGAYSVIVTDADGCSTTVPATITAPNSLSINITGSGNVSCFGACDGYASAAVSGGSAPFSYNWMPGGTGGASVNNLCAANYTVTVTDANGCTASTTVNIIQPNALIASISHTDVTCHNACDAQATAVYVGGTGPYTFLWTPSLQSTPTATGLCDGVHNLTVTDSMGCTANASVVVTEPTLLAVSTTTTNSNCGNADGSACASVIGGSPPFIYSWNDPATQSTSCANSLNAGVYTISITDNNGCSVTNVANVNDNLAPIVTIPTSSDVTCGGAANGSAQGSISGGILPYSINWVPGGQNTTFVNGLSGGIYSMVVTDSVGCTGSASVTINEPSPLISGIISSFNTSCNLSCDGSATVLAGGGTAPYTYLWNDLAAQTTTTATGLCAQTYSVTTTDFNGCTSTSMVTITEPTPVTITLDTLINILCNGGNNGQVMVVASGGTPGYTYNWTPSGSGPSITNLIAGSYQVTVTDLNTCTQTATFTVQEPAPLVLSPNSNPSTCGSANGSAGVSVLGGVSPYSYFWTPTSLATAIIPNVAAGTYSVTVTDFNGCTATSSSTVTDLPGPVLNSGSFTTVEPSCHGFANGSATVIATGGQPLYTYVWNTVPAQTTQTATALPAGVYQVTVFDQNECAVTGTVQVFEPTPTQVIVSPTDTICIGMQSPIYAAGFGGTQPYTYTWNPNLGSTGGPFLVAPTLPTTYTVSVVDNHGCTSGFAYPTVFVHPQISVTATDVSVCDGSSVIISAAASGGTGGPYTYSWSNGVSTDAQTVSPTGATSIDYTVTANDMNCSVAVTDVATVVINPQAVSFINAPVTSGCEDFTANFTAISNLGTTFDWDFGDGSSQGSGSPVTHTYTNSGLYTVTVTVTTALGCVSTVTDTNYINVFPAPTAGFTSTPQPASSTSPIVSFIDQSIGADEWDWDFIYTNPATGFFTDTLQNPSFTYPDTGVYIVQQTVTNSFGCTDVAYNNVEIIPEYVLYAPNAFTPNNHDGLNDVFMPSGVGIDPDNFEMTIYDRWGNQIFKTTDVTKGWDGRANGGSKVAQTDVYVWKIRTKDYGGQNHSYVGHVTIVK